MHNSKGNNCNLSGHEVRKHSGNSISIFWSCSSANNWPDPSPIPWTQLTLRNPRNLLPTLPFPRSAIPHARVRSVQNNCNVYCSIQTICSYKYPPNTLGIKSAYCQNHCEGLIQTNHDTFATLSPPQTMGSSWKRGSQAKHSLIPTPFSNFKLQI